MITIEELDEAIRSFCEDDHVNVNIIVDECEKLLNFLEIPHTTFSILAVLQLTRFLLDKESMKKLNTKLNNKALW